jgi:hypothetical protein
MSAAEPCYKRSFFPEGNFNAVPVSQVQQTLRKWFARWGLPGRLRVDNGSPWGSSGDLPPDLALWLWGLGVDLHWNDPGQPQQNGVVERSQGTAQRWAEPQACATHAALQQALDRMDRVQRETYPVQGGVSRLAAWPGLKHSGRPYTRTWERQHWNLERVLERLSGYVISRRVSHQGRVTLYNIARPLGQKYRDQWVSLTVDVPRREWLVTDEADRYVCHLPAPELTAAAIQTLHVARRGPTRKQRRAAKLSGRIHGKT